jgi:hypothetical protein
MMPDASKPLIQIPTVRAIPPIPIDPRIPYIETMPRGPKGEKRPADVIGNAVHVMRVATGEIEDKVEDDGKNAAAVALGRMGGKARAKSMSAKLRKEIAKAAAKSRWSRE